ncbi:MAG: leucyl aminopeptidase [Candidatus Omnitrophica bacterium]|nr:leucyl aminopeptidase [Candidatus Omnitrophota bacterium]
MIAFSSKSKKNQEASIILLTSSQSDKRLKRELEKGEIFPLLEGKSLVLFVGLGKSEKLTLTDLRIQVRRVFLSSFLKKVKDIELIPHTKDDAAIKAIIEGALIGPYVWDKYKSKDKDSHVVKDKNIIVLVDTKKEYEQTAAICEGVKLTRDLVNDNADFITSEYLEKTVKDLIKGHKEISVEILNKKELKAKGLGLHLAVNQASNKEPKLIIVSYQGGKKDEAYTAIVGKGLTFDTGGLNLKPSNHIETMKIDMSGAAAVCGILKNVLKLGIKKNLLFVLGIAENSIGSAAYKPGDVIVGYAGKSVEIGNTDAEGRLVLADAFSYVVKNYKPAKMIDMATLTGACVMALGFDYSGLFANNDELAKDLLASAEETDDRAWRLPIYAEIKEYIKSPIADLKNTSSIRGGGASTAAEFLHQFVGDTTWAHLDIAGTAFCEGQGRFYYGHGATGAGVRLLTNYLLK